MNKNEWLRGNVTQEEYEEMVKIKGREPLNPIGSCFDSAAFEVVFGQRGEGSEFSSKKLVHGLIIANAPGQEGTLIAHAWVEAKLKGEPVVLDTIWGEVYPKHRYYEATKPRCVKTFTRSKAFQLWAMKDHPGPWHPQHVEIQEGLIREREQKQQPMFMQYLDDEPVYGLGGGGTGGGSSDV